MLCAAASGANAIRVLAVPVTDGQFALEIPNIPEVCVTGTDVHLAISVRAPAGSGAFTSLGVQRVVPVLSSLTSGLGDFNVAGRATAADVTATNTITATSTVQGATLRATGQLQGQRGAITSPDNAATTDLGVFQTLDTTRGIAIRSQSIITVGSAADQDITLQPKGNGAIRVNGKVNAFGARLDGLDECSTAGLANCASLTGSATTDGILTAHYFGTVPATGNLQPDAQQYCTMQVGSTLDFVFDVGLAGAVTLPIRRGDTWFIAATPRTTNVTSCNYRFTFLPFGVR